MRKFNKDDIGSAALIAAGIAITAVFPIGGLALIGFGLLKAFMLDGKGESATPRVSSDITPNNKEKKPVEKMTSQELMLWDIDHIREMKQILQGSPKRLREQAEILGVKGNSPEEMLVKVTEMERDGYKGLSDFQRKNMPRFKDNLEGYGRHQQSLAEMEKNLAKDYAKILVKEVPGIVDELRNIGVQPAGRYQAVSAPQAPQAAVAIGK